MADDELVADRMAERLRDWERDIRNLKARAAEAGGKAEAELREEIEELERRRDEAKAKLAEFRARSGAARDELAAGFEEAGRALEQAWDRARARF